MVDRRTLPRPPRPAPTATVESTDATSTVWKVTIPARKYAKVFLATTYPDSDLIYLQTSMRGRSIAASKATILLPLIRAAIERARATTNQPQDRPA